MKLLHPAALANLLSTTVQSIVVVVRPITWRLTAFRARGRGEDDLLLNGVESDFEHD